MQKVEIKQEEIKEEAKKAKVSTVRKKAEDLPEIADYERPDLEKYEKSDFTPSTREKPEKDKVGIGFTKREHQLKIRFINHVVISVLKLSHFKNYNPYCNLFYIYNLYS